uniref:Bacterial repeat domain-containing protein n=1 Tax=uncultured prokaryote TaxID=198431 RepID=H5SLG4_9ZZZZ|nr:hypothetical protein HGMM_F46A05C39 [uncultured prokaryote]
MRWIAWPLLPLVLFLLLAPQALAQEPTSRVQTTHPLPLLVEGLRQTGFPKDLRMGTQVCAPGPITYTGEGERYRFLGWRLRDSALPGLCISAVDPGPYTAVFQREVLIRVTSPAPGIAGSRWAEEGSLVPLTVPEVLPVTEDQRWRFSGWSGGITPFSPDNAVVADRPLTLEARYALEYRVQVVAPEGVAITGGGWYPAGQTAVLRAPATVSLGAGQRLRLTGWQGEGAPADTLAHARTLLTFPVNGPAVLLPQYVREFLVEGYGLRGARLLQTWAPEGDIVSVSAPEEVLVEEGVRWRFVEWSGGMEPNKPTTRVVASRPITLQARYAQEYRVQVLAPEGVTVPGAGWFAPGQTVTLRLPDLVPVGEDRRWRWMGWEGEPPPTTQGPVVTLKVDAPVSLRPRYALEVLVEARTPKGLLLREWKALGDTVALEAPASLDGVPLRLWREEGTGVVLGSAPRLEIQVTAPLRLEAVYEPPRPPGRITLQANAPVALLVDGREVSQLPAEVPAGSKVCVPGPYVYIGEGERYRFTRWSTGSQETCLTPPAGSLTASFEREVLLTITSPLARLTETRWVPANHPIPLEVPALVEEGETRWRFAGWSSGENPFSPTNTLALSRPTTVEAKFTAEYRISIVPVEGVKVSGEGWYPAGARALLRAPALVPQAEGRRLRFTGWEETEGRLVGVGGVNDPEVVITVNGPLSLRPRYVQEYLVHAETPQGILTLSWVEAGKTLELEAPSLIPIVEEEERLRFTHWQEKVPGAPPLAQLAKLVLTVDRPLNLEAVYRREFKVNLQAPYGGSGSGWYAQNATAILSVPPQPQAVLFLKKTFQGFAGFPQTGPVLQVTVQGPMTVSALYRNEVDFRVLVFLVGGLLVAFLIWRVTETRMARPQPTAPTEQEEEVIEEIVEEEPQPPIATGRRPPPGGR